MERLDRYGVFAGGRTGPGVGQGMLEQLMDGHLAAVRNGEAVCPQHLGYFLASLEEAARRSKHREAPKRKDQRIAEGKRPARRGQPKPGRGPAIGADPKLLPTRSSLRGEKTPRRRHGPSRRRGTPYDGSGQ